MALHTTPPSQEPFDICIADDNAVIRRLLHRLLSSMGFRVIAFSDGQELIDHFENNHYVGEVLPVVLTDYKMPRKNGAEAAKTVRTKFRDIKIIMLTAETTIHESVHEHIDVLLRKPIKKQQLEQVIRSLINNDRPI
jgi:CheY-like chemotaxis protein